MYNPGDIVWLSEFDNGEEIQPRQQALFVEYEDKSMAIVSVKPMDIDDDGLREIEVDQIEGLVDISQRQLITVTKEAQRYLVRLRGDK